MSFQLPMLSPVATTSPRDGGWLTAARRARQLAWLSLAWMTVEGLVGVVAGLQANSISVLTWAASSAVEGLASAIVIWRFTGRRTMSEHAERRAQRWVAASFFLLVPYVLYETIHRLAIGEAAETHVLSVVLTATSVVGMPLLGYAKLRLGERLGSGATAGEGTQNLLCAVQAAAALIAVATAGALPWLDPLAAVGIALIAAKVGVGLGRGEDACCSQPLGFEPLAVASCQDELLLARLTAGLPGAVSLKPSKKKSPACAGLSAKRLKHLRRRLPSRRPIATSTRRRPGRRRQRLWAKDYPIRDGWLATSTPFMPPARRLLSRSRSDRSAH